VPIVTISRQYGSGGSEVAERVATALGWQLYDNAVLDEVASRLGMTVAQLSAREERVQSMAERIVSAIALSSQEVMPTVGGAVVPPGEERIVEVTKRVMEEVSQSGPGVIVGRGVQCVLATRSDALHVFCYAPFDALVAYAMTKHELRQDEAKKQVTEMNARREAYVKRHWGREWRDPANYHLCVNTGWLGLDGAAELIVRMANERFDT
jgi:cytidylate kinase